MSMACIEKGANYQVYVVEFSHNYSGGSFTERYYFNGKEAAMKYAKKRAKGHGCGEFENATCDGSFWLQAVGSGYWVGVQEIKTMD